MKLILPALFALTSFGLLACRKGAHSPCKQDFDCETDQVCFIDGCGDPARDIRVEVTPSGPPVAQDLVLTEMHAHEDLRVPGAAILRGLVRVREKLETLLDQPPNTEIAIHGQGESKIIPGQLRLFDSSFAPPGPVSGPGVLGNDGSYSLPVSAGEYSITAKASTENPADPPLYKQQTGKVLEPGTNARVDFLLEALNPVYTVTVKLTPPPSSVEASQLRLQALDPITLLPISQQTSVNPGSPDTFTLLISPTVRLPQNRSFILQVTPKDSKALIPTKIFPKVSVTDSPPPPIPLDFGNFGPSVTVTGTVRDSQGSPIDKATVYFDGSVSNGGTFKSQSVLTNEAGTFAVRTLPSTPSTTTLWAIPPSQSTAGILRTSVRIALEGGIGPFTCPDKARVRGKILRPDGGLAPGVTVTATPIQPWADKVNSGQTSSAADSSFELRLDPGVYQLDFIPNESLPRTSRCATVSAGLSLIQLGEFAFSNGRRITGNVFATDPADQQYKLSPKAKLRFFRLAILDECAPTSVLLGTAVSDDRGTYSIILPTAR